MPSSIGERPAPSLDERVDQLRRALPAPGATGEAATAWRAFADAILVGVWEAVGRGDLDAPARVLARLERLVGWAEDHSPAPGAPEAEAARAVDHLIRGLDAATEGLALPAVELRVRKPDGHEHAILEVLYRHRAEVLTRGDVHKQLPKATRPSAARVSQILERLAADGLVVRAYGRSRGAEQVAHYRLWESGIAVWERVGRAKEAVEEEIAPALDASAVFGAKTTGYLGVVPERSLERW